MLKIIIGSTITYIIGYMALLGYMLIITYGLEPIQLLNVNYMGLFTSIYQTKEAPKNIIFIINAASLGRIKYREITAKNVQ